MKYKIKIQIYKLIVTFSIILLGSCSQKFTKQEKNNNLSINRKNENKIYANFQEKDTIEILAIGSGENLEIAKNRAFKSAIEKAIGVYIDAVTISQELKIVKDEILKFSNGYIAKYDILEEKEKNNEFICKYKVWIRMKPLSTKFKNNLLSQNIFDYDDLALSLRSELNHNKAINEIMTKFFDQFFQKYPDNILVTIPTNFSIYGEVGLSENIKVKIDYSLMWNQIEIYRLAELLLNINSYKRKSLLTNMKNSFIEFGLKEKELENHYDKLSKENKEYEFTNWIKNFEDIIFSKKNNYLFSTDNIKDCFLQSKELRDSLIQYFSSKYVKKIDNSFLNVCFYKNNEIIFESDNFELPKGNDYSVTGEEGGKGGFYVYSNMIKIARPDYYVESLGLGNQNLIFDMPIGVIEKFDDVKIKISYLKK
jgi:hypothetical protein